MLITFLSKKCFKICLALFALSCTFQTYAQNLIQNGSFTNLDANWTFFAPGTETEAYNTEDVYGGISSTNIVAEVDDAANLRQTGISVVAGQTYWFSLRHSRRTDGGAPATVSFQVKIYDGTTSFLDQTITSTNTVWDWQCESFQFTPASNVVAIDFLSLSSGTLGTLVDDITITPVLQPITLSGPTCQGGNVTFAAPSFPNNPDAVYENYNWTGPNSFASNDPTITFSNLSPVMNGDYTCTMTFNTCLTVTGTYHLNITPNIIESTAHICDGTSYPFYNQMLTTSGDYFKTITHPNSCDSNIVLHLTVDPLPDKTVTPMGNVDICEGDTILLLSLNTLQNCSYSWTNNTIPVSGGGSNLYAYTSGAFQVEITSDAGCKVLSRPINVAVHQPPVATIAIAENDNPCISDTLHFTSANVADHYTWTPGSVFRNTGSADERMAAGVIQNEKTEIILTVYDEVGCHNSDSLHIQARSCCYLFIPDGFTPNGDGLNDYFKPQINKNQKIIAFRIYDRWGKQVFITTDNNTKGWNGNYPNGDKASSDVYMYGIEYTCGDVQTQFEKGDVTLVRH